MKKCIRKIELSNSLTVLVYDTTCKYYEDYHLVRLEIESEVALKEDFFDGPVKFAEARSVLGDFATYRRSIEKMGVPFAEIEDAREKLISSFVSTALPYLGNNNFPRKFVLSELSKASAKVLRSAV